VLARFARDVERDIGITVSVGLSCNKFLAKIASDLDKPRGFAVLGNAEAAAFLAPKPVTFIFGVGKATQARLARDERILIEALQDMLDTALQSDDGAWAAGIERAGTDKPCDKAAAAIAYVVGAGMLDIAGHSYLRAAARKQERTRERTRLEVER